MTDATSGQESLAFDLIGGEARVRELVDRFYDLMDLEPEFAVLRALHPWRYRLAGECLPLLTPPKPHLRKALLRPRSLFPKARPTAPAVRLSPQYLPVSGRNAGPLHLGPASRILRIHHQD